MAAKTKKARTPQTSTKRKRARGCCVCDCKIDPNAKIPARWVNAPDAWHEWLCVACMRDYAKCLERPPLNKPGAVLGVIEWASARTWSFARRMLGSER